MGDYNTELPSGTQHNFLIDNRGNVLKQLIDRHNLVAINTLDLCTGAEFSSVPYNSTRQTLIDHILIQSCDIQNVASCSIVNDSAINVSNHRPIMCKLEWKNMANPTTSESARMLHWRNVKQSSLDKLFDNVEFRYELVLMPVTWTLHQRMTLTYFIPS